MAQGESNLHIVSAIQIPSCVINVAGGGLDNKQLLPNEMQIYEAIETKEYELTLTGKDCGSLVFNSPYRFQMKSENVIISLTL